MDKEYYFNKWPLGSLLLFTLTPAVERVVAHLESEWLGTDRPWYAVATVPVCPTPEELRNTYFRKHEGRDDQVIAGELPEDRCYTIHCINSSSRVIFSIEQIDVAVDRYDLQVITWPDENHGYLAAFIDRGDSTVGEHGGAIVVGAGHWYVDGWPMLPLVPGFLHGQDEVADEGTPWLYRIVDFIITLKRGGYDDEGE